jgi:hypothetical protein
MHRTLTLLLVLLASAAWVQAQAYPQSEPAQSAGAAAGHMTVQGCLSGSDGNYTLTADNGTTYQLTGNTAELAELKDHVGHEVQITGKRSSTSATSSSTAATQKGVLEVKSMKHISKTCKSAAR